MPAQVRVELTDAALSERLARFCTSIGNHGPTDDPRGRMAFAIVSDDPGARSERVIVHSPDADPFAVDSRNAVSALQRQLTRMLCLRPDATMLHAAMVVASDGRAWLLAGEGRSGKTSLGVALTTHGFHLHADDVVAVRADRAVRQVRGCPFPVRLRADAVDFLRGARLWPETLDLERESFDSDVGVGHYGYWLDAPGPGDWHPLAGIIYPSFVDGATGCRALDAGRAAFRMVGAVVNGAATGEAGFDAAVDLAEGLPAYELDVGSLGDACRLIVELTAGD